MPDIDLTSAAVTGRGVIPADLMLAWDATTGQAKADTLAELLRTGYQGAAPADLNSATGVGFYYADSPTNRPTGRSNAAVQVVRGATANDLQQLWYGSDGAIYYRTSANGGTSWNAWTLRPSEIATEAESLAGTSTTALETPAGVSLALTNQWSDDTQEITRVSVNTGSRGLAGNDTDLWSLDRDVNFAYAYSRSTGAYDRAKTFAIAANSSGADIYGLYLYVQQTNGIAQAYLLSDGSRQQSQDISEVAGTNPSAILVRQDRNYHFAADGRVIVRNDAGTRQTGEEWTVGSSLGVPVDATSDGTIVWLLSSDGNIYAHELSDGTRVPSRDLHLDINSLGGCWTDGETAMYVGSYSDQQIYVYHLPGAIKPIGLATTLSAGIARLATRGEGDTGMDNTTMMSPLRVRQAIATRVPAASTTTAGVSRLATSAEVTAATSTVAVTTVANVKSIVDTHGGGTGTPSTPASTPNATTTIRGSVELATEAETFARTDTERAVTPVSLADYARIERREWVATQSATGDRVVSGITTDGTHTWVLWRDSQTTGGGVDTYDADHAHVGTVTLDALNDDPRGIAYWTGSTPLLLVANGRTHTTNNVKLFAYVISTGARDAGSDVALEAANADPIGISVEPTRIAVVDGVDKRHYGYSTSTRTAVRAHAFNFLALSSTSVVTGAYVSSTRLYFIDSDSLSVQARRVSNAQPDATVEWLLTGMTDPVDLTRAAGIWQVIQEDGTVFAYDDEGKVRLRNGTLPAASEWVNGLVRMADAANVRAGSSSNLAVSPAALIGRTASTSATGLVELATNAEATTGADTVRAVTPAGLKAHVDNALPAAASATSAGIVELATNAETTTGTDTTRAVTPAGAKAAIDAATTSTSPATATTSGTVELATEAEALAGTVSGAFAMTPLRSKQATDTTVRNATLPGIRSLAHEYETTNNILAMTVDELNQRVFHFYVASGQGTCTIVNSVTGVGISTFTLNSSNASPAGAHYENDKLYVIDDVADAIFRYTSAGVYEAEQVPRSVLSQARILTPHGLWADNNYWYVAYASSSQGYVHRFDRSGNADAGELTLTSSQNPFGLDSDGQYLYTVDVMTGDVMAYTVDGQARPQYNLPLHSANAAPSALYVYGNFIYVHDSTDSRIYAYARQNIVTTAADTHTAGTVRIAPEDRYLSGGVNGDDEVIPGGALMAGIAYIGQKLSRLHELGIEMERVGTLDNFGADENNPQALAIKPGTYDAWLFGGARGQLLRLNLFTGQAYLPRGAVSRYGFTGFATAAGLAWVGDDLYGVVDTTVVGDTGRLFTVDPVTGAGTYVSSTANVADDDPHALFADDNPWLYVMGDQFSRPRRVALSSGIGSAVTGRSVAGMGIAGGVNKYELTFHRPGDNTYMVDPDTGNIYNNILSGTITNIGTLTGFESGQDASGLKYMAVAADGDVYGVFRTGAGSNAYLMRMKMNLSVS